jgi:hypothetical protein
LSTFLQVSPISRLFWWGCLFATSYTLVANSPSSNETSIEPPTPDDFLHFGREWPKILPHLQDDLYPLIIHQRYFIERQKENCRPLIEFEEQVVVKPFYDEFKKVLSTGYTLPTKLGGGGVYILYNASHEPSFLIKPNDEAILCLNNPKHRGSPFNNKSHRLRDAIPLYKTCETEAAVSAISKEIQIEQCTPETHLAILSSPLFYDLSSHLQGNALTEFIEKCGIPASEKLCSIQRFIPDSIDLQQAMHEWFEAGFEEQFPLPIDQETFEEVILLLWIIYDSDGHSSNFRIFFKSLDEKRYPNSAIYGIKKIDNGLSLPEENNHFLNYLSYLPNAKIAPSQTLLEKITSINEETLCKILDRYHLSQAKPALKDRIEVLKNLSHHPGLTLDEINKRFELLNLANGKSLAMSPLPLDAILDSLQEQDSMSNQ